MDKESARPIEILLVEDSPSDAMITAEALQSSKIANTLHLATDGMAAMRFLRREGEFSEAPAPDLILLDLNLPRKNGAEVLSEIKADPRLKQIPVVILSSSRAEQDVLKAYKLQANCFITKPVDLENFLGVVKAIEQFWFAVVTLPAKS